MLSAATSADALARRVDPLELPGFLGGCRPDQQCFVSRAERVPDGLSQRLRASEGKYSAGSSGRVEAVAAPFAS